MIAPISPGQEPVVSQSSLENSETHPPATASFNLNRLQATCQRVGPKSRGRVTAALGNARSSGLAEDHRSQATR